MFCPKCRNQVPDGSLFCECCGFRFEQPAAPYASPTPAPAVTPPYVSPTPAPAVAPVTTGEGVNFDFSNNGVVASAQRRKMYEYKVLSQKDKWFSGKFDPAMLEQAINSYAQQGWRVIGCATADIPGFGAARQEFITLLEREV